MDVDIATILKVSNIKPHIYVYSKMCNEKSFGSIYIVHKAIENVNSAIAREKKKMAFISWLE